MGVMRTKNRIWIRLARISRPAAIEGAAGVGGEHLELAIESGQRVIHHLPSSAADAVSECATSD